MTLTKIVRNTYTKGEIIHVVFTKIESGIVKINGMNKFWRHKTQLSDVGFKYILNPEKIREIFGIEKLRRN